jgi:hypothetical protein
MTEKLDTVELLATLCIKNESLSALWRAWNDFEGNEDCPIRSLRGSFYITTNREQLIFWDESLRIVQRGHEELKKTAHELYQKIMAWNDIRVGDWGISKNGNSMLILVKSDNRVQIECYIRGDSTKILSMDVEIYHRVQEYEEGE